MFLGNSNKKTTTKSPPEINESNTGTPNLFTTEDITAFNDTNFNATAAASQNNINSSDNNINFVSTISENNNILDKNALDLINDEEDDSENDEATTKYDSVTENNLITESPLGKMTLIPNGEVTNNLAIDSENKDTTVNQSRDSTDKPFTLNLLEDASSDDIVLLGNPTVGTSIPSETSTSLLETLSTVIVGNPFASNNETEQSDDIINSTNTNELDYDENTINNEIANEDNTTQEQRPNDRAHTFLENDSLQGRSIDNSENNDNLNDTETNQNDGTNGDINKTNEDNQNNDEVMFII